MANFNLTISQAECDALRKCGESIPATLSEALGAYLRRMQPDAYSPLPYENNIGRPDYRMHETLITLSWNVPKPLRRRLSWDDGYAIMTHLRAAIRDYLRANGIEITPEPRPMVTQKLVSDDEPLEFCISSEDYRKLKMLGGSTGEHVRAAVMANRRGPAPDGVELEYTANLNGGTIKNLVWKVPSDVRGLLPGNTLDRASIDFVRASVMRYLRRKRS